MKKILIVLIVNSLSMASCAFQMQGKWCDNIPADSYSVICEAASILHTNPEEIALGLELGELGILAKRVYTAREVMDFLNDLEAAVNKYSGGQVSWQMFLDYVVMKYAGLSPEAQAALKIIMNRYQALPDATLKVKLLSPYDWSAIKIELVNLKDIVAPFLLR